MHIRKFRTDDTDELYSICLQTVDAGSDGSHLFPRYPRLPGDLALGACLKFQADLAFVAVDDSDRPIGYTVGVLDSATFYQQCETAWWPALRKIYPEPTSVDPEQRGAEQRLLGAVHHPVTAPQEILDAYPSHLHINLLPAGQGCGCGRMLLERLLSELAAAGSKGVFLGVPPANTRAIGFYRHLGFVDLPSTPGMSLRLGMALPAKVAR